jgi:hypothetical protein
MAETQPKLQPALLSLSAMISQDFIARRPFHHRMNFPNTQTGLIEIREVGIVFSPHPRFSDGRFN